MSRGTGRSVQAKKARNKSDKARAKRSKAQKAVAEYERNRVAAHLEVQTLENNKQNSAACDCLNEKCEGTERPAREISSQDLRAEKPRRRSCQKTTIDPLLYIYSDKAFVPAIPANAGNCLFYAVFNACTTSAKRVALVGGSMRAEPAEYFRANCLAAGQDGRDGYSCKDMAEYLKHLQHRGVIKGFVWERLMENTHNYVMCKLFFGCGRKLGDTFILTGTAPKSDKKDIMKRIVRRGRSDPVAARSEQDQIECLTTYEHAGWNDKRLQGGESHAVAILYNDWGFGPEYILLDSAMKKMKRQMSLEDLAFSLVRVVDIFRFEIEV